MYHCACKKMFLKTKIPFQVGMDLEKVQKHGRDEKTLQHYMYTHYGTMVACFLASNAMHLHP